MSIVVRRLEEERWTRGRHEDDSVRYKEKSPPSGPRELVIASGGLGMGANTVHP